MAGPMSSSSTRKNRLIIFEGSNGSLAELYRQQERGNEPDTTKAEKITYNRQTGAIKTEGTRMMTGGGLKK